MSLKFVKMGEGYDVFLSDTRIGFVIKHGSLWDATTLKGDPMKGYVSRSDASLALLGVYEASFTSGSINNREYLTRVIPQDILSKLGDRPSKRRMRIAIRAASGEYSPKRHSFA